ncbi:MAG: pro-sigmaK processing inhibitor BofA family protein [Oscillospiraceae bacterium]|nr:pro-sigmaK processing inhibitor BofA family protein [Oscillospiraceae bacterium]
MRDILFAILILAAFLLSAALLAAGKSRRPFAGAAGSVIAGLAALLAVNLTGAFTGVSLPISPLAVGTSAFLGVPGVTVLLLLNLIF